MIFFYLFLMTCTTKPIHHQNFSDELAEMCVVLCTSCFQGLVTFALFKSRLFLLLCHLWTDNPFSFFCLLII